MLTRFLFILLENIGGSKALVIAFCVIVPFVFDPLVVYNFVSPATEAVPVPYVVFVSCPGIPSFVISALVTAVVPVT